MESPGGVSLRSAGLSKDFVAADPEHLETLARKLNYTAAMLREDAQRRESKIKAGEEMARLEGGPGVATPSGDGDDDTTSEAKADPVSVDGSGAFQFSKVEPESFSTDFKLKPELVVQQFHRARSHDAVLWPGKLQQLFVDMLLHRLFVLLAGSTTRPYDGRLYLTGLGQQERWVLEVCNLVAPLFTDRARDQVNFTQWCDTLRMKYHPDLRVIAALIIAYVSDTSINDLTIDRKLFQQMEQAALPLKNLHRAIFYGLTEDKSVLIMKDLRTKTAWAVLSMDDMFLPQVPDTVSYTVEDWEKWLMGHLDTWSLDAHKLWLSSLASLAEVSFKNVESAKGRECFSMDCVIQ